MIKLLAIILRIFTPMKFLFTVLIVYSLIISLGKTGIILSIIIITLGVGADTYLGFSKSRQKREWEAAQTALKEKKEREWMLPRESEMTYIRHDLPAYYEDGVFLHHPITRETYISDISDGARAAFTGEGGHIVYWYGHYHMEFPVGSESVWYHYTQADITSAFITRSRFLYWVLPSGRKFTTRQVIKTNDLELSCGGYSDLNDVPMLPCNRDLDNLYVILGTEAGSFEINNVRYKWDI